MVDAPRYVTCYRLLTADAFEQRYEIVSKISGAGYQYARALVDHSYRLAYFNTDKEWQMLDLERMCKPFRENYRQIRILKSWSYEKPVLYKDERNNWESLMTYAEARAELAQELSKRPDLPNS